MKIKINNYVYEIVKDEKNAIDESLLKDKLTDYFDDYDYILGDWAYGKLRLKGFNTKKNKNYNKYNDYVNIDKYIKDNCAYGCRHFILKKIEKE